MYHQLTEMCETNKSFIAPAGPRRGAYSNTLIGGLKIGKYAAVSEEDLVGCKYSAWIVISAMANGDLIRGSFVQGCLLPPTPASSIHTAGHCPQGIE